MFTLYTSKFNNKSIHQPFPQNKLFINNINSNKIDNNLNTEPKVLSFNCFSRNNIIVFYKNGNSVRYSIYSFNSFQKFVRVSDSQLLFGSKYVLNMSHELTFSRDSKNCGVILMSDLSGNVIFYNFNGTSVNFNQLITPSSNYSLKKTKITLVENGVSNILAVEVYYDLARGSLYGQLHAYYPSPVLLGNPFLIVNNNNNNFEAIGSQITDFSHVSVSTSNCLSEGIVYYSINSIIYSVYYCYPLNQSNTPHVSQSRAIDVGNKVAANILSISSEKSFIFQLSQGIIALLNCK
jgi:hypothetical protein